MSKFGVTLKMGLAGHGKRQVKVDGEDLDTGDLDGNLGVLAGLALNFMDGHGFGIDLNFLLRRYKEEQPYGGEYGYGTFAVEPAFGARFQVARPLYMFVGLGPRLGLEWMENVDDFGIATGFRMPVNLNFYMNSAIALAAEFGVGFESTIWFQENGFDAETYTIVRRGPIFDFAFGVRFM